MKCLDLSLPAPAENLACDEALLDLCETGNAGETLRFWESPVYFIVAGYGNSVATEVNVRECATRGIPILRRCSGGGTVVQGPGCLNYSLVLRAGESGPLGSITSANRFIMEQNRRALENVLKRTVTVRGHTDLAVDGLKFSGNAQRRRKQTLLFHGTLLLNFDLPLIGELLPMPSKEPDYRHHRAHQEFLINLQVPAESIKQALQEVWQAGDPFGRPPTETIASLARDRYATNAWNLKL